MHEAHKKGQKFQISQLSSSHPGSKHSEKALFLFFPTTTIRRVKRISMDIVFPFVLLLSANGISYIQCWEFVIQ